MQRRAGASYRRARFLFLSPYIYFPLFQHPTLFIYFFLFIIFIVSGAVGCQEKGATSSRAIERNKNVSISDFARDYFDSCVCLLLPLESRLSCRTIPLRIYVDMEAQQKRNGIHFESFDCIMDHVPDMQNAALFFSNQTSLASLRALMKIDVGVEMIVTSVCYRRTYERIRV